MTVYLLIGRETGVVSVYAHEGDANDRRDKYNADPFIEPDNPDQDAPYEVQAFGVREDGSE